LNTAANTPLWFWVVFNAGILLLLAIDLGLTKRREREISVGAALWRSFAYFALAMAFGAGVFFYRGPDSGFEFLTGYLIEWSLSVDNIFVFVLIFTHFAVPVQYQHRVLFWGIIGALVMRGILIYLGVTLIQNFHWIVFLFGSFLIASGIKMIMAASAEPDLERNRVVNFIRRHFRVTEGYEGQRFFIRRNGQFYITPLLIVLVLIELTDLVFALDSIPAIFAVSQDPFIVYTANVFAILGLRSMYFALAGIIHRFEYLKYGLSIVLIVVGAKMIVNGIYGEKVVPTEYALLVTAGLIFGSMILSLIKTRGRMLPEEEAAKRRLATGWVPGSPERDETKRT
jgi:tellurite resistance protein TerC